MIRKDRIIKLLLKISSKSNLSHNTSFNNVSSIYWLKYSRPTFFFPFILNAFATITFYIKSFDNQACICDPWFQTPLATILECCFHLYERCSIPLGNRWNLEPGHISFEELPQLDKYAFYDRVSFSFWGKAVKPMQFNMRF